MQRFLSGAPVGIRFGELYFSEPVPLARWRPPKSAGLYVVLLPDFTWVPRPFQPLYFGELGPSNVPVTQEEYVSWFRVAAGRDLYIASCEVPGSRAMGLVAIKDQLIQAYRPVSNSAQAQTSTLDSLADRLCAVERRSQEQEALLRVVLAAMGKLLEPPPEPRKRNFGFHDAGAQTARQAVY